MEGVLCLLELLDVVRCMLEGVRYMLELLEVMRCVR